MAHAPVKHDPDRRDDRKDDRREAKVVGEEGSLVMPLAEPAPGQEEVRPTIGVKGEPIEDGERDPDTIAEEQRRRSAEYEANIGRDVQAARADDERRPAVEDSRRAQHDPKHADHHQSSRK